MRRILVILALSVATTACVKEQSYAERLSNNKNPLTALHADATSTRYENGYWEKQKRLNTSIWVNAAEFCKWHNEYTNCYAVNEVYGPRPELKVLAKKHHKRKSKRKSSDKQAQSWTEVERRQKKEAELAVQKDRKEALLGPDSSNVADKDKADIRSEDKKQMINLKNGSIRAKKLSKVKRKKRKSKRRAKRHHKKRRAQRKNRKNRKKRATKQAKASASTVEARK